MAKEAYDQALSAQQTAQVNFEAAAADDGWNSILSDKQRMTSMNVTVMTAAKVFYTINAVPGDMYDAMIVFDEVSPTTPDQ